MSKKSHRKHTTHHKTEHAQRAPQTHGEFSYRERLQELELMIQDQRAKQETE